MKKLFSSFVLILFLFSSFITPIHADSGPKPSVTISFKGIDEVYYVTLLSDKQQYGPYSKVDEFNLDGAVRRSIWEKFNNYEDEFYFVGYFEECTVSNKFHWGYYPPETFKILIYLEESDTFIESEIIEKQGFDSYYTISIENNDIGEIVIKKTYDYFGDILSFITRLAFTLFIEILFLEVFFKNHKSMIKIVIIANIITQVILNVFLDINGIITTYIYLECIIPFIEAFIYMKFWDKSIKRSKIITYSIIVNFLSFLLGFMLLLIFSFI